MNGALTIAGSDPTGGAGLQGDLQVFRSFGIHGSGVLTALTIQDSSRVHRVLPVFPSVVLDQLRTLLADFVPSAVKIGMLATDDVVRNVVLGLVGLPPEIPVIIDPVLAASDGTSLLERRAYGALRDLCHSRTLLTPNRIEAEILSGESTASTAGCERAGRQLIDDFNIGAVLIKGGHAHGAPDDLLVTRTGDEVSLEWIEGERIEGPSVHGTGCALSSAITASMAGGQSLRNAINEGRAYVRHGIETAKAFGAGAPLLGLP